MTKKYICTIFLLSQCIPFVTLACDKEEVYIGAHYGPNVVGGKFCVPLEKIRKTPSWDGDFSKIPISFFKATKIAQESLHNRWEKSDEFITIGVSVQRVGSSNLEDKWCFTIDSRPKDYRVNIVTKILMDGGIVKPRPYP